MGLVVSYAIPKTVTRLRRTHYLGTSELNFLYFAQVVIRFSANTAKVILFVKILITYYAPSLFTISSNFNLKR